ncbi:MAG: DUF4249 family protein [Bacteroidota bacterium]
MKLFFRTYVISISCLALMSCQDVIDVAVPENNPRLVLDAIIRVDTTLASTEIRVIAKETRGFFEELVPASLENITFLNVDSPGGTGLLGEIEAGSGIYVTSVSTEELIRDEFLLQVRFEGELYLAQTKFVPTVPIDSLQQGDNSVFDDNDTELIVTFTDDEDRDDFYIMDFGQGLYITLTDEFNQGQTVEFSYFYDDPIPPGEEIQISILGADERFYSYMTLLLDQSEEEFGIFETPAVTVRGNLINATDINNIDVFNNVNDSDNFALGYFAIVQEFTKTITIE